jgi:type IV pilus assembly protein PilZ
MSGDENERERDEELPPSSDIDRRSADRFDVVWCVDCETEDTFLYAAITNISALGIFVRTEEPLRIGTRLRLRFAPSASRALPPLVVEGRVQWINPARPGCPNPGMGIRFVGLTLDIRERLVEIIRTIAYLPSEIDEAS